MSDDARLISEDELEWLLSVSYFYIQYGYYQKALDLLNMAIYDWKEDSRLVSLVAYCYHQIGEDEKANKILKRLTQMQMSETKTLYLEQLLRFSEHKIKKKGS